MTYLDVHIDGDGAWPDLIDDQGNKNFTEGQLVGVARITNGTTGGSSSVTFRIELPDGRIILAQTTFSLIYQATNAFAIAESNQ